MSLVHRRVVYSGRVQGVGFRMTAHRLAQGRPVEGSVRNLPDGTVELLASGEAAEVDRLLADVAAALDGKIRDVAISEIPPGSTEPSGFSIRY